MARPGVCVAFLLTVVGTSSAADAWAADVWPIKAPPSTMDSTAAPRPCTDPSDFVRTDCQLTWQGVTVFGIVDAGVGTASDATIAMELGYDGVLMNTGIAGAQEPVLMAEAMKHAVIAGRQSYLAGRMPRKLYATASSPLEGVVR